MSHDDGGGTSARTGCGGTCSMRHLGARIGTLSASLHRTRGRSRWLNRRSRDLRCGHSGGRTRTACRLSVSASRRCNRQGHERGKKSKWFHVSSPITSNVSYRHLDIGFTFKTFTHYLHFAVHSALAPLSLTTLPRRGTSALITAARSAGGMPERSRPRSPRRLATSGIFRMRLISV